MTRHRADAPSLASVITEVRRKMTDRDIVNAAVALTVGDESYSKTLKVAGRQVRLHNRGSHANMGRFGGGWMTVVGIQMGKHGTKGTIIVNLGKGSIRIDPVKK